jgi:hypothetical protein
MGLRTHKNGVTSIPKMRLDWKCYINSKQLERCIPATHRTDAASPRGYFEISTIASSLDSLLLTTIDWFFVCHLGIAVNCKFISNSKYLGHRWRSKAWLKRILCDMKRVTERSDSVFILPRGPRSKFKTNYPVWHFHAISPFLMQVVF